MSQQSVIRKYGLGLASTVKTEEEFALCLEQLQAFYDLVTGDEKIYFALTSPFVIKSQQLSVLEEVLDRLNFDPRVTKLIWLLGKNGRLVWLRELLEELPEIWAREQGIASLEVSSAVELTGDEKKQIEETLKKVEKKPVRLTFSLKPEILGGLLVRKGSIYYDASLKGSLLKLKEIISQR
ncbi:MAG TPA: ATP synthase F1 subunit delta [Candidatus Saccharicenans sp.]|jgi:F-type H+-transporting ATPase subunit delta|nr:ATP synthase F1 subunit delta [Candidatus Saccharicenans sp.]HRD02506.1 ATP synthase F1 subunit delta [Candidatus Saccharicenans sp.]